MRGDRAVALHVAASLAPLGSVRVRPVGRRYGLFVDGLDADAPLGVVEDGAVYFKAGPDAVTRYLARGMRPLRAPAWGALRGYWRVPGEVLADGELLVDWARAAADAVRRFGRPRRVRRRAVSRGVSHGRG